MQKDDKTGVDLDLDALAPKKIQIRYKQKLIQVKPLSLEQFAKLYDLAGDMKNLSKTKGNETLKDVMIRVEALVKETIPELKDDTLNQMQLTALINLLSELSTPQDKALKELAKRGINLTKQAKNSPKVSTS